jgi:hypothetical protein
MFMSIKPSLKKSGLVVGAGVVLLFAACSSHNNPLKKAKPDAAAKFLVRASQAAEKQLHVFNSPGGYYYGECMSAKAKKTLCTKLYKAMVSYAGSTVSFKRVTIGDLTDTRVFKTLKDDYQREQFNAL